MQEQTRIQDEISNYALAVAGTEDDLDKALVEAGLEHLEDVWPKESV